MIRPQQDPYKECAGCLVRDRCTRRSGASPMPDDYKVNPECSGFVMIDQAMNLSKIPPEFRESNKNNFQFDQDNMKFKPALENLFSEIKTAVMAGTNVGFISKEKGTGKTKAVTTLAAEFIFSSVMDADLFDFENPLALYVKYGTWANDLRKVYQLNDLDYTAKSLAELERMKNVPLLILDDIGSGRLSNYVRDITYDLIDFRKEHKKATFFTSNFTEGQLGHPDMLGDTIATRVFFNSLVFEYSGRNRRKETTYYV
ncbi:ATP-binding protein [Bacillus pumilus]|nr:ATP-binding protein [Bacillus pumilus]